MVYLWLITHWPIVAAVACLVLLVWILIQGIRNGAVQIRTYDMKKAKDRQHVKELIQGGPDERYIDSEEF